ncbi:Golgi-associated kinase 1A isoform X2 [Myxocyprinus asiaticus]|uniref:Golgi-associated kinase 1A isoform X2 n=1 Tax=Myxocyprinus asiaticus TaxID=70543 RepID=UPI00222394B8|nr:Golgi-associated kinase 1A isoform X2 [Myxocyprinus asiaticus]
MALRVLIKFRLKCRCVVAFLCLFILSVVMIYTLPNFPSEQSTVHLLGPLNNKPSRLVERRSLRPHLQMPSNRQSGTRKNPEVKDSTKHLLMINHHQLSFSSGKTAEEKVQVSSKNSPKNRANKKEVYLQNINKHLFQPFVATGNRGQAIKPGNSRNFNQTIHLLHSRHDPALPQSASMQSLHPNNKTCRHKCTPDGVKAKSLLGQFTQAQQVVNLKQSPGEAATHERQAEPSERKSSHSGAEIKGRILAGAGMSDFATDWCMTAPNEAFTEDWNQTKAESLPWLNEDDIKKMTLLSRNSVLSKARLPGHGQVLQVGFSDRNAFAEGNHIKHCQMGGCALIKHPNDWFEVFAFHLDRVLGLNRSLPAVLRKFHSDILPYKYTNGAPRPVVWWDPNIRHLSDAENDQNSFLLTWPQYQTLLQSKCGTQVPLNSTSCVGVHHSEWGRLALFDFLLQVNDRLDRYCCGFRPDPSELCVENMLHIKCGNPRDLNLVHILVRKTDPSRLVFIDNAGRPHQPQDNLNFRLVKGIDEFPEQAISVLQSGCLEKMLLRSLSVDREFWVSRGGPSKLRSLIQHVEQRAKALLQHIQEKKLKLNTDI